MREHPAPKDAKALPHSAPGGTFGFFPGKRVGGGRFFLERFIGRGGMGVVWKAFDERLSESVALKFLSSRIRDDRAALLAMRREASRSHSLSHPHIVRTHDMYEVDREPVFLSRDGSGLAIGHGERERMRHRVGFWPGTS